MPRYTKQRDRFRCGPIVILNALKWAGADISYSDYADYLTELASCGPPPRGTFHKTFDQALRVAGKDFYSARRIHHPTLGELETHLQDGGALVLNYEWHRKKEGWNRHFSLIVDISPSGRSFYIVNGRRKRKALQRMNREQFKKWELRFQRTDRHYKAWFLTRAGE